MKGMELAERQGGLESLCFDVKLRVGILRSHITQYSLHDVF